MVPGGLRDGAETRRDSWGGWIAGGQAPQHGETSVPAHFAPTWKASILFEDPGGACMGTEEVGLIQAG